MRVVGRCEGVGVHGCMRVWPGEGVQVYMCVGCGCGFVLVWV